MGPPRLHSMRSALTAIVAAGAIILKKRPGEYELVRQLLGHKNVQTTINLLEAVRSLSRPGKVRVVVAGSSAEYGATPTLSTRIR